MWNYLLSESLGILRKTLSISLRRSYSANSNPENAFRKAPLLRKNYTASWQWQINFGTFLPHLFLSSAVSLWAALHPLVKDDNWTIPSFCKSVLVFGRYTREYIFTTSFLIPTFLAPSPRLSCCDLQLCPWLSVSSSPPSATSSSLSALR